MDKTIKNSEDKYTSKLFLKNIHSLKIAKVVINMFFHSFAHLIQLYQGQEKLSYPSVVEKWSFLLGRKDTYIKEINKTRKHRYQVSIMKCNIRFHDGLGSKKE